MLKYDSQLSELKSRLSSANRILIVLPQALNDDNLAAGLTLALSLKNHGKKVDIVSTGTPLVSQSNLFGIGDIKSEVSKMGGGNFIISLDGVVDTTGTMSSQVPALEKLDWYPEGSKLNLVFHVVPGQRFEPTNITSRHEQAGYDLTFVLGTQALNELGTLFTSNSEYFAQNQVINIDTNQANTLFGFTNIIDASASSLSEIVAQILPSLTLNLDRDAASNIIAGIYSATNNLTQKINPDTFIVVSQAVQVGGTLPGQFSAQPQAVVPQPVQSTQPQVTEPSVAPQIQPAPQPEAQSQFNFAQPSQPETQYQPQSDAENSLTGSPFIVPPQDINIPLPSYQPPSQPEPQSQINYSQADQIQSGITQASQIDPNIHSQISNLQSSNAQGFDLRQIFQNPGMPSASQPANVEVAQPAQLPQSEPMPTVQQIYQPSGGHHEHEPAPHHDNQPDAAKVSLEERPMGEVAQSANPEIESTPTPDWLVPKIFKGGNLG